MAQCVINLGCGGLRSTVRHSFFLVHPYQLFVNRNTKKSRINLDETFTNDSVRDKEVDQI